MRYSPVNVVQNMWSSGGLVVNLNQKKLSYLYYGSTRPHITHIMSEVTNSKTIPEYDNRAEHYDTVRRPVGIEVNGPICN